MELSGRVAVAIIYICEAHATDEWPISSARFNAGRGPVCVAQPKRNAERCQLARRFASDFGLEGLPLLVDAAEGADADAYERAYAPWPLRFHGVNGAARTRRVAEMLEAVGLSGFGRSFPAELSGGMRKRVALAQLLAYEPGTLLMDEPFGALDAQLKLLMQEQLLRIWQAKRQTVVFVTHDLAEAITVAQRVVVFTGRPGRIKQIETVTLPAERDVFKVRFLPEFEAAYTRLWDALAPEIRRGEAA